MNQISPFELDREKLFFPPGAQNRFATWGNSGIEPDEGTENQLSRNIRGHPSCGLATMESDNGILCRTGRVVEADIDLRGEPDRIDRARGRGRL